VSDKCSKDISPLLPKEGKRIRWGILGGARIARLCVIPALNRSRNGEIGRLGCRSEERGQTLARQHGIPLTCCRYEEVIEDPHIDAIYVPLPNHLHKEWTLRAIQAGKHVLCEKPMAVNAEDARCMAQAAKDRGVYLMEALMYRFHPRSRRIKELIDQGAIGEPKLIRVAFCFLHPDPSDARFQRELGGGALLDVGTYGVSLARWILSAEPESVQACAEYGPTGVDVTIIGLLRFPGGCLATVEASFMSALQQTFSIIGSGGAIDLPHDAFIPWEKEAIFHLRGTEEEKGKLETVPGADQYRLMVEHFSDRVLTGKALDFPPEESVANMRVLDALACSARERRAVDLEPYKGLH
jgi:xylose dehydrogenase (NAD/NADP)